MSVRSPKECCRQGRTGRIGERTGLLEVYDLRTDKTKDLTKRGNVLAAIKRFTPNPEIHVWPVFGRAQDARNAGFSGV